MPATFPLVFRRLLLPIILISTLGQTAHAQVTAPALGMPRTGAARVLRLIDAKGKPLTGSLSEPRWETRGGGLFFTRESGGTSNVWRAFPDPQDSNRYPTWRALPVTQFQPPMSASGAVPIWGQRALLMVSNATGPHRPSQIIRYDLSNQSLRALTNFENGAFDPSASPDGNSMAFAATRSGVTSIYTQSLAGGAARRVALNARRPAWQDNSTLLVESVVNSTIFRLTLTDASRPAQLARGSQASATRDGSLVVLAATGSDTPDVTRLYILAGDGSGLRAITGTEGARDPDIADDGSNLAFDAPPSPTESQRALWILPLERDNGTSNINDDSHRVVVDNPQLIGNARVADPLPVKTRPSAPIAQITGVATTSSYALKVLGIATAEQGTATLEIGAGTAPSKWSTVSIPLPRDPNQPLAMWTPSASARGPWTLRLSVLNDSGAAQSVFLVRLPLISGIPTPVAVANPPELPPGGPLPRVPLPNLPAPPSLPALPRPAPLPRATPVPTPRPTVAPTPRQPVIPIPPPSGPLPSFPTPLPPAPPQPSPNPTPTPRPTPRPVPQPLPTPEPLPSPAPLPPRPPATPAPTPLPPRPPVTPPSSPRSGGRDDAKFNISGTLAHMAPNQSIWVTFWAQNTGNQTWDVGRNGTATGAVRLVARWVDFDTNTRRKWNLNWLKSPVPPGERTSFGFDLTAPPQPGRYKLIYGLVRVPSENWTPPAYNAPQQSWPNEFAVIAFAVDVK